jgi:GT2 family glycosyltransferase
MAATVTVVIPMYNDASWIGDTLQSVARQTCGPEHLEIIAVDDASSDDCGRIARSFLRDHAISGSVVTHHRNAGVSAARNTGWNLATGEWIQFLDSDDLLAPEKIGWQAEWATHLPGGVGVVYSTWQPLRLLNGKWQPHGAIMAPCVDDDTVARMVLDWTFGYVGPTLIRKSFLRELAGFDETLNIGEDFDLMLRLAMSGVGFSRAPSSEALFFYRQRKDSLWRHAVRNVDSMTRLVSVVRRAELFLRQRNPAALPGDVCAALARRYGTALDTFFEQDRKRFRETVEWIHRLGLRYPPGTRRPVRLIAPFVGYERAQALRFRYRKARDWGRSLGRHVR